MHILVGKMKKRTTSCCQSSCKNVMKHIVETEGNRYMFHIHAWPFTFRAYYYLYWYFNNKGPGFWLFYCQIYTIGRYLYCNTNIILYTNMSIKNKTKDDQIHVSGHWLPASYVVGFCWWVHYSDICWVYW